MARLLITGASGFLGGRLLPALTHAGHQVVAPVRRAQPPQEGVAFTAVESIETTDWGPLLAGVDAIVHLAAIAHVRNAGGDAGYDRVNAEATLRLARRCEGRVSRFVFASSIRAICGPTNEKPLADDDVPAPTDAYGRAKFKAEAGLAALDLPTTILRPVAVYGAGVKGNLGRLARLADLPPPPPFGALRASRSFLSVDNFVSAVLFALTRTGPGAESFNLADPSPSSVAGLVGGLRAGLGRSTVLLDVPPALLGAAAAIFGRAEDWAVLSGALTAPPRRLLAAGWSPPIADSRDGAVRWGRSLRGA